MAGRRRCARVPHQAAAARWEAGAETKEEKRERRASGKSRGVTHDADETGADLAGACGGADLPDLAGSGGNWRAGGGSGRKAAGPGWDGVSSVDIMALPVWQFELFTHSQIPRCSSPRLAAITVSCIFGGLSFDLEC